MSSINFQKIVTDNYRNLPDPKMRPACQIFPYEVWARILTYLDLTAFLNSRLICKQLHILGDLREVFQKQCMEKGLLCAARPAISTLNMYMLFRKSVLKGNASLTRFSYTPCRSIAAADASIYIQNTAGGISKLTTSVLKQKFNTLKQIVKPSTENVLFYKPYSISDKTDKILFSKGLHIKKHVYSANDCSQSNIHLPKRGSYLTCMSYDLSQTRPQDRIAYALNTGDICVFNFTSQKFHLASATNKTCTAISLVGSDLFCGFSDGWIETWSEIPNGGWHQLYPFPRWQNDKSSVTTIVTDQNHLFFVGYQSGTISVVDSNNRVKGNVFSRVGDLVRQLVPESGVSSLLFKNDILFSSHDGGSLKVSVANSEGIWACIQTYQLSIPQSIKGMAYFEGQLLCATSKGIFSL